MSPKMGRPFLHLKIKSANPDKFSENYVTFMA
ncbi:hypothetical protein BN1048_00561 [Jeotgalicoccus saudimassiliensis]|uniref:Uncharacterized protein n=1 Tax=Jeotgalicoccus saudimassiliensis TaxID=1461582 RepID=A0A078LWP7_9STAP|nr:hypothetical protein BN1048_00561 [Jeotgalicoccus saudimassiliensis]